MVYTVFCYIHTITKCDPAQQGENKNTNAETVRKERISQFVIEISESLYAGRITPVKANTIPN